MKIFIKVVVQAFIITGATAIIAAGTNLVRSDGIPLVTDIPYEIFAPCKDSEATSEAVSMDDLPRETEDRVLYVDARPVEFFLKEHVEGAINVPYSALFGASKEDIATVKKAVRERRAVSVIVYGAYADPAAPDKQVDFGKPLARQLVGDGIKGVRHVEGGLESLNKKGIKTVKKDGDING
ncbi:MAG: rhodanese-like domain-containing protein [Deltaproteobacteria bacterium]|nr:rhodanese-like domain-containing protein [Deltaproteobacteria bacterium]